MSCLGSVLFISILLGTKVTVVLLIEGWYLGETEPAPKDEDNALGLG